MPENFVSYEEGEREVSDPATETLNRPDLTKIIEKCLILSRNFGFSKTKTNISYWLLISQNNIKYTTKNVSKFNSNFLK